MSAVRTISILALCLLVIISSSSFMIGIHFCSGNIRDIALFTPADRCVNEQKIPPCHRQESKPCCEDETVVHEANEVSGDVSKIQLSPVPAVDIDHPLVLIAEVIPASTDAIARHYHNYDPPLRWADITVEYRVFLI